MKTVKLSFWKKKRIRFLFGTAILLTIVVTLLASRPAFRWGQIPAGAYEIGVSDGSEPSTRREIKTGGFRMTATEVTVSQYMRFLNLTRPTPIYDSPQIRFAGGRYRAIADALHPVAYVSLDDARAYAAWLSKKKKRIVRLPTADEWEIAARGGLLRAPYPWGWGQPAGRAQWDADQASRVASFEPNAFGLYDMAGNVAEWCEPDTPESAYAPARGGSWAERDPAQLHVFHPPRFPHTYRDADVGFRVLLE